MRESARVPPRETSVPAPESITRCVARTAKPTIIDVLHNKGMYRYQLRITSRKDFFYKVKALVTKNTSMIKKISPYFSTLIGLMVVANLDCFDLL